MVRGRDKFQKYKRVINTISAIIGFLPKSFRVKYYSHLRNTNGSLGLVLRYATLKTLAKKMGDNVSIHPGVFIFNPEELVIGSNVSIHPMCYLECYGGLTIGDNVSIAHATTILTVNHFYEDPTLPINDQGVEKRPTKICDNVWIGAKVTVLGGVMVNSVVVIAAGAVVTKNVETNTVVAGVPATIIRRR
ncbi:TPA: acyltransferase [Streptococcus suis]